MRMLRSSAKPALRLRAQPISEEPRSFSARVIAPDGDAWRIRASAAEPSADPCGPSGSLRRADAVAGLSSAKCTPTRAEAEPVRHADAVAGSSLAPPRVEGAGRDVRARRAVSCLVEPCPDDRVLAVTLEDGRSFILAVLERAPETAVLLRLDPAVELAAERGTLTLKAANGLRLESQQELDVVGQTLNLLAERGSLFIHSLRILSDRLRLDTGKAALIANVVEAFAERVATRAKRISRHVSELEQVHATEYQLRVDDSLSMRARDALFKAQRLFKLDGEQVHIG